MLSAGPQWNILRETYRSEIKFTVCEEQSPNFLNVYEKDPRTKSISALKFNILWNMGDSIPHLFQLNSKNWFFLSEPGLKYRLRANCHLEVTTQPLLILLVKS